MTAYDIGPDGQLGTADDGTFGAAKGNIGAITVGGNMSSTSIAAGISPGPGLQFGDADDSVVVSSSLQGAIQSLTVKGTLTGLPGSTASFGVEAHGTLGALKVGSITKTRPWPSFGNLVIKDGIA